MGKKFVFIVLTCFCFSLAGLSQPVVFINAGSRASYGSNQELTIDSKANCRYYLREVNGAAKDSSFFSISQQQLDSFFSKANEVGFFNLNNKYNGGSVDGAGIYISINSAGKKHNVQLNNTDQPAINELVTMLNRMLEPLRIRINYGQFVTK
jgi:hypothetical protein